MSEKAYLNEGEIKASKKQICDAVGRGLCLPPSYKVWSICDMEDYVSVLVESTDIPAAGENQLIPLLTPEIKLYPDGSVKLIGMRCTRRGSTIDIPQQEEQ